MPGVREQHGVRRPKAQWSTVGDDAGRERIVMRWVMTRRGFR